MAKQRASNREVNVKPRGRSGDDPVCALLALRHCSVFRHHKAGEKRGGRGVRHADRQYAVFDHPIIETFAFYPQVKKNRYDGERGDVGYEYDRINHVITPVKIDRRRPNVLDANYGH